MMIKLVVAWIGQRHNKFKMAILDFLDCFFSTEEGGWLFYSKDRGIFFIFFIGKSNGSWLGTDEASGVKNWSKLSFEWQAQHWVQVICLMLKEVTSLMVKSTQREMPLMMGIWVSSSNFFLLWLCHAQCCQRSALDEFMAPSLPLRFVHRAPRTMTGCQIDTVDAHFFDSPVSRLRTVSKFRFLIFCCFASCIESLGWQWNNNDRFFSFIALSCFFLAGRKCSRRRWECHVTAKGRHRVPDYASSFSMAKLHF